MIKKIIALGVCATALSSLAAAAPAPRPLVGIRPGLHPNIRAAAALPTWNFAWSYKGHNYSAQFVGTDPAGGASTTVPVYLIPVKLIYQGHQEDPTAPEASGVSPVGYTVASPIFDSSTTYIQGGTNVGTTQYLDAFQRAALWGTVSSQPGYHVLLGGPTVEPVQTLTVPQADGAFATEFGVQVIEADLNWYNTQIQKLLKSLAIPTNALPVFITTQAYLTSGGGCCIGSYHTYNGATSYIQFSFMQKHGVLGEDVSLLSHEGGEWIDDPMVDNTNVPPACGSYEAGLVLTREKQFGTYPYTLNGVTYHLQDLLLPPYFGAPRSTSVNGWFSFQGARLKVCQG